MCGSVWQPRWGPPCAMASPPSWRRWRCGLPAGARPRRAGLWSAGGGRTALGGVAPGLVVRRLHQWPFMASLGLDLIGFAAQLVALRRLPLFAAQAIIAGTLAVTAVFAAWLMHLELAWREWLAV